MAWRKEFLFIDSLIRLTLGCNKVNRCSAPALSRCCGQRAIRGVSGHARFAPFTWLTETIRPVSILTARWRNAIRYCDSAHAIR
ncbi:MULTISPECIES: hypothetical protein [Paraburkholderia]|jgi:hypothetical protein|uniref:hypothetical protein n=1 Tax=Paraburkholderia TaxID=1822464 RepID=UPI00117C5CC3|nr:hypothetical protein [Paraburkholderia phenazinium]